MSMLQIQEILRRCYDPDEKALRINENSSTASYSPLEAQDILNLVFDEDTNTLRVIL